jgi:hypothetical protein
MVFLAIDLLDRYDVPAMIAVDDDIRLAIIRYMLPHYLAFAGDVEPLRLIDIREDAF